MLSIKNIIQAKRFLPSNSQPSQVFQTFCSFKGSKKVIFLDTSLGSKNPSKNRPWHRGPPQFKNMCGHKCSQGVENKCLRRCKTMEKQRRGKLLSRTCRNHRTSCYFSPGDLKFCRQNGPRFGVQKRTPKWRPLIQSQFDLLVSGRLGPRFGVRFWTPKRGPFVGKIFAVGRKIVQVSIVSAGTRQKFCIPRATGFPCFAAPPAIVLHALRTFMPTPVLELFKNMCGHKCSQGVENKCLRRCKTMEKQRRGKLLSRTCRNHRTSCYFSPGD